MSWSNNMRIWPDLGSAELGQYDSATSTDVCPLPPAPAEVRRHLP